MFSNSFFYKNEFNKYRDQNTKSQFPKISATHRICLGILDTGCNVIFPKGQLILKYLFGVFNSPKNNSTWGIIVVKLNFFIRFLGELKIPKRHFEINWPLKQHFFSMQIKLHTKIRAWFQDLISRLRFYNMLPINHNLDSWQ